MLPPMQGQQQQYGGQQQQASAMTISPAPAPQAARPPPKKGPQTFEEMGVPAAPKESECVSLVQVTTTKEPVLTVTKVLM